MSETYSGRYESRICRNAAALTDSRTFAAKLMDCATEYDTVYMKGVYGAPITESLIAGKSKQYPSWYTPAKQAKFRALIGKNVFGFDCVCLIKGMLWGWSGDSNSRCGGAEYASNGVPDVGVDGLLALCDGVSSDFTQIAVGEILWMSGHVGVYIGGGLAVECTPIWADGVQITGVSNVGAPDGYHARKWKKHGKLNAFVYYPAETVAGDINGDGLVNAADVLLAKRAFLGSVKLSGDQLTRGDLDGDGRISATDYLWIKRAFLGTL